MFEAAIRAERLTKRFEDVLAVDGISFEVGAGTTTALLGGNGAGKTTTISMVLGLLLPTAGRIMVLGEDMIRHRYRVLPRINFSSPYVDLPKRLTVAENLTVYGELYGLIDTAKRLAEIADELAITDFLDRPTGQLSSGQRTRVALAKALLNEPELLLLDEPTASLDPDTADWVRGYLSEYQRRTGATILLASHNMTEVERLCSDVLIMKTGRLVDRGTPEQLVASYGRKTLEEVFLHIARAGPDGGLESAAQQENHMAPGPSSPAPAPPPAPAPAPRTARHRGGDAFSPRRVAAMVRRYWYLLRGSWPRIIELAYWPVMQMVMWGFITEFLLTNGTTVLRASGMLIAAVLLWDVMFRGNIGVAISFLEEMWSRNLGQLFASPLRPYEWAVSLITISLIRTVIGVVPAALLAIPLYHYSIFEMGLPLLAFFANLLIFGSAVGLSVAGIVLRYGLGAESLAWVGIFAIAPITGIYYPVATLPEWLQPVAWALPSAYVFEGMRTVLADGVFRVDFFLAAVGLNVVYLAAGCGVFLYAFRLARIRGLLLQVGE